MTKHAQEDLLTLSVEEILLLPTADREWLALNSDDANVLAALAVDEDTYVRATAVGNEATPLFLRIAIAPGLPRWMRERLGRSVHSPELIAFFSRDDKKSVRRAVAQNASTPARTLARLSKDQRMSVRYFVASNTNTSKRTLSAMALRDKHYSVLLAISWNQNTPPKTLEYLVTKSEEGDTLDLHIAGNRNTPPHVLAKMARSGNSDMAARVAGNSNTGVRTFEYLLNLSDHEPYPEDDVLIAMVENDAVPFQLIAWTISLNDESVFDVLRLRLDIKELVYYYLTTYQNVDRATLDGLPLEWVLRMAGFPPAP